MGIELAVAGIGLALSAAGTATSYIAGQKEQAALKDQTAASMQAEDLRRQQMELDSQRKQRDIIRSAQVARSTAISNAGGQGALTSSGLYGGLSQVTGQESSQITSNNENLSIGRGIFDANAAASLAGLRVGEAKTDENTGRGLAAFGGSLAGAAPTIQKIGTSLFSGSEWTTTVKAA